MSHFMPSKSGYPLLLLLIAVAAVPLAAGTVAAAAAADEADLAAPVKEFKLQRGTSSVDDDLDLEEEELARWEPAIVSGSVETSLTLGFMNLSGTLLQHDQMIYKYDPNTETTYWGDVEIVGESAFNPTLHVGYNLKPWICLEGYGGISVSEYTSSYTNRRSRKAEATPPPPTEDPLLSEFDLEHRSLITLQSGLNAILYPLNINGDGKGRWHPFLAANAGRIWYDMNSNFTSGSAGTMDVGFGGGLRLLADENISLRLEAMYHMNSVEFTPSRFFTEIDEGTTQVPLNEYPEGEGGEFTEQPITAFDANDVNYLAWSIGVHGSF